MIEFTSFKLVFLTMNMFKRTLNFCLAVTLFFFNKVLKYSKMYVVCTMSSSYHITYECRFYVTVVPYYWHMMLHASNHITYECLFYVTVMPYYWHMMLHAFIYLRLTYSSSSSSSYICRYSIHNKLLMNVVFM